MRGGILISYARERVDGATALIDVTTNAYSLNLKYLRSRAHPTLLFQDPSSTLRCFA